MPIFFSLLIIHLTYTFTEFRIEVTAEGTIIIGFITFCAIALALALSALSLSLIDVDVWPMRPFAPGWLARVASCSFRIITSWYLCVSVDQIYKDVRVVISMIVLCSVIAEYSRRTPELAV